MNFKLKILSFFFTSLVLQTNQFYATVKGNTKNPGIQKQATVIFRNENKKVAASTTIFWQTLKIFSLNETNGQKMLISVLANDIYFIIGLQKDQAIKQKIIVSK